MILFSGIFKDLTGYYCMLSYFNLLCCVFQDLSRYTENSTSVEANSRSISQMANSRQEKIARYKEQKEQERRIKVVENFLSHDCLESFSVT